MDATLKEISNLVKEVHPESRKKGMIFDFAICYQVKSISLNVVFDTLIQDPRMARYRIKEVGQTVSGKKSPDDTITLKGSKFQIGDFMDIAIKV